MFVSFEFYRLKIMKFQIFTLLLFIVVFLTDAVEVTDEDSPLVSYLLAKVQRLEAKMMAKPNIRNTGYAEEEVTAMTTAEIASEKQCNCANGVVTYIRWGNSTCPYGASTIYSGVVGGSLYDHTGTAADPLCLPPNPQYLKYQPGYQNWAPIYGAEYETHDTPLDHSYDRNVPCALCQANGRTNKIMIPSRYTCPSGWTREYYGYLMAGAYSHKAATQFTCIDKSLEQIPGSGASTNGYLFYTVEAHCGHFIPCSPKELTCVVCTK